MVKKISVLAKCEEPAVSFVRVLRAENGLHLALGAIARRAEHDEPGREASVLVLGRYNFETAEWRSGDFKRGLKTKHPNLLVGFGTVHAGKGKEADNVVVVGLAEGKYEFPCEIPPDPILEILLPEDEEFPHAEERRLFYVALTRARHRVYLVYNPMSASAFIHEFLDDAASYPVTSDEFDEGDGVCAELPRAKCPLCGSGYLVRCSQRGRFFGCSHFPHCRHVDKPCPLCDGMMETQGRFRVCVSTRCSGQVPVCPKCGGAMVERSSPYGRFWGCSNYRGKNDGLDFTCTHTEKI